jgi:pyrophosphatase PpaX
MKGRSGGIPMVQLVIFDMDGTLLNTQKMVLTIYQRYFKLHPSPVKASILPMQEFLSKSYEEVFKILQIEPLQEHLKYLEDIHASLVQRKLKTYPYAKTMLQQLKAKGIKLGLLTSELKTFALQELEQVGLLPFFDAVVTYHDVIQPKPHPEGLATIIQQCQVPLDHVIYIGDTMYDLKVGQALGVLTFGVHQAHELKLPFTQTFPNLKTLKAFLLSKENHLP